VDVTVIGTFDRASLANEARRALLAVGVPARRIAVQQNDHGHSTVRVHAQSSLERDRIRDVLRRNGASSTAQEAT
jgi:hypothetical protein